MVHTFSPYLRVWNKSVIQTVNKGSFKEQFLRTIIVGEILWYSRFIHIIPNNNDTVHKREVTMEILKPY